MVETHRSICPLVPLTLTVSCLTPTTLYPTRAGVGASDVPRRRVCKKSRRIGSGFVRRFSTPRALPSTESRTVDVTRKTGVWGGDPSRQTFRQVKLPFDDGHTSLTLPRHGRPPGFPDVYPRPPPNSQGRRRGSRHARGPRPTLELVPGQPKGRRPTRPGATSTSIGGSRVLRRRPVRRYHVSSGPDVGRADCP